MKVDVIVLTNNSERTLKAALDSVLREVDYNQVIVIDGGSKDKTLEIVSEYDVAKIIKNVKRVGLARYLGAKHATTEWICYVDSDIYLCNSWYEEVLRWVSKPKVMWIQGLTLEYSYIMPSYALSKTLRYIKYGCIALSNSLIRRQVVLSCNSLIKPEVNVGEDFLLYNHIKSLGGKVILEAKALSFHMPDAFLHDIYAYYRSGVSQREKDGVPKPWYLAMPLLLMREALMRYILVKDVRLFPYFTGLLGSAYLAGYLRVTRSLSNLVYKLETLSKKTGYVFVNEVCETMRDLAGEAKEL